MENEELTLGITAKEYYESKIIKRYKAIGNDLKYGGEYQVEGLILSYEAFNYY